MRHKNNKYQFFITSIIAVPYAVTSVDIMPTLRVVASCPASRTTHTGMEGSVSLQYSRIFLIPNVISGIQYQDDCKNMHGK